MEDDRKLSAPEMCLAWQSRLSALLAGIASGSLPAQERGRRIRDLADEVGSALEAAHTSDAVALVLNYRANAGTDGYSTLHALQCAVLAARVAPALGLPTELRRTLMLSAMTMNVGMFRMQDALAQQAAPPTPMQAEQIRRHPQDSVKLLLAGGIDDPVWLSAVSRHHSELAWVEPFDRRPAHEQIAHVLQVLDRYTAMMSPRASRPGREPRGACRAAVAFGGSGAHDEVGLALMKTFGLYPPGTFVRLAGGEQAMVLRSGERASAPVVAAIVHRSGTPLAEYRLINTGKRGFEVSEGLSASACKVRPRLEEMVRLLEHSRKPASGML